MIHILVPEWIGTVAAIWAMESALLVGLAPPLAIGWLILRRLNRPPKDHAD